MSSNSLNVHRGSVSEFQRPGKKQRLKSNSCQRRPFGEISPNSLSPPIAIPRISINCHGSHNDEFINDDVFDISSSEKENFLFSPHPSRILFPSYGTSPSQALKMEEETNAMFRNFASNLVDDVKKLGKGSFGTVILGFWKKERVAVKIIKRRSSLTNELNALALNHENVTKIKHVIEETDKDEQNNAIIVMEYVGQNNLQALIEKNDLTNTVIKSFLVQIAKGLNYCHNHLVAHLDLKPSNVLVTSTGQCKLADFGCSKKFKTQNEIHDIDSSCPGTPGYQAPELFTIKKINLKSDIFSLGILIWQLITKEHQPYPGWHPHTIIFKVTAQNVRPTKEPCNVWSKYQTLYKTCWSSKAEDRPTSRDVLRNLMNLDKTNGSGSSLKMSSTSSRKSSGIRI